MHDTFTFAIAKHSAAIFMAGVITMPQLPEHIGVVIVSGFFGGLARFIAEKQSIWPTGLGTIITGMVTATFLWPVAQPMLEPLLGKLALSAVSSVMFGGFVTGLMGVSLIGLILDFTKSRRSQLGSKSDE